MEETRPLLVERRPDIVEPAASEYSSSTTTTAVLLLAAFVTFTGSFDSGCASGYSSAAESGIREDLGLTTAQYSVFASIFTFGAMLGATVSGKIADLIGRKKSIWLCDIFYVMGWLAILFAKGVWWLDFGRLTVGFGAGIQSYVASVYVAEITPKKIRGGFTAANMLVLCFGISLMFFMGNVLTWRTMAIIGLVPCFVQSVGMFFIPESPRWLAKIGREKELENTLRSLRGKNADIFSEMTEIRDYTKTFEQLSKTSILNLFERRYAHQLTIGVGIMLLQQFGGSNGILYYASSIFEAAGCSASVGTTTMAIIQIPFTALNVLLVDRSGRRPLLMVSAAGTCLGNILVGLGFLFQGFQYSSELCAILVLSGILIYSASFTAGMNATPYILMSEIFPVNIRGSAGSLVIFANWFTAWIVSYSFNFLFDWSSPGVFFIFAAICGSTILFVAKLVPETKGRSLEEIQASMTHLLQ
ncbi:sugar transporter ERD6-like 5 isoform X1 [Rhododendron vialii]|uniref:sugar transporter ERD6-like 5 isoform X1 n=2 Tax=Rhododendron vialii TaxID=182163 RepID=UPI00265DBF42|nr:sugar transporter ERD6-like 5 isoform X1 [Rhododendron vialii]